MKNSKNIDPSKIKTDEKSHKNIHIYYIGYVTSNIAKPPSVLYNNKINVMH